MIDLLFGACVAAIGGLTISTLFELFDRDGLTRGTIFCWYVVIAVAAILGGRS